MKRIILVIGLLSIGFLSFAQTPTMPEKMANSKLFLRPGISEMDDITVGEFFLNKKFKSTELLDGTISTVRYGTCTLDGNNYILAIEFTNNTKVKAIITYTFFFQDNSTILDKVTIHSLETQEYEEAIDYNTKIQIVSLFKKLEDDGATKEN